MDVGEKGFAPPPSLLLRRALLPRWSPSFCLHLQQRILLVSQIFSLPLIIKCVVTNIVFSGSSSLCSFTAALRNVIAYADIFTMVCKKFFFALNRAIWFKLAYTGYHSLDNMPGPHLRQRMHLHPGHKISKGETETHLYVKYHDPITPWPDLT